MDEVICECKSVTQGAIQSYIEIQLESISSIYQIVDATGAGRGCGSCLPKLVDVIPTWCNWQPRDL